MDWIYYLGIIFSIVLMLVGLGGMIYFLQLYQEEQLDNRKKDILFWISLIIGGFICLAAFIFISPGVKRWLIIGLGLLCFVVPVIVRNIVERKHQKNFETDICLGTHLLFLFAVLCIPGGRICMMKIDDAYVGYIYRHSELKTIDYVKTTILTETDYQWAEGSTGDVIIPAGEKSTEWLVIVTTDQSEIPVCRKLEGVDYEKLYPQGGTVVIYKGRVFHRRP